MWGLETIKAINKHATRNAEDLMPWIIDSIEQIENRAFQCPMMGDACGDIQDEHLEQLFVDISGMGAATEMALTMPQFQEKLKALFNEHGTIQIAMSEFGQFQGYVEVWKI
jgi:hypothetical protein